VLTNWYIRRSRQRFWDGDADAIETLHTGLEIVTRVAAPLLPYVAEEIYTGLHADEQGRVSVHLTDWPDADELPGDDELVAAMDHARDICSATLSVRKAHGRRVRLPLASLTVATPHAETLAPFVGIIADEVNVREVRLTDDLTSVAGQVLQVVPATIGPRLGRHTQDVIRAVKAGDWSLYGDEVVAGGHRLEPGEYTLTMVAEGDGASATLDGGTGVIVLDVDVTPDLEQEGRARDLIRLIQQARRDADLAVTDRIAVILRADPQWANAAVTHRELIAGETLAVDLDVDDSGSDTPEVSIERSRS